MGRRLWSGIVGASALALFTFTACGGGDETGGGAMPAVSDTTTPPGQAATPPETTTAPQNLPPGVTPEMVTAGKEIFTGVGGCFACHGQSGEGTALGPNLTDNEWLNTSGRNYDEIVQLIMTGVPEPKQFTSNPMPPRGGSSITDEQVREVAAYVMTLGR